MEEGNEEEDDEDDILEVGRGIDEVEEEEEDEAEDEEENEDEDEEEEDDENGDSDDRNDVSIQEGACTLRGKNITLKSVCNSTPLQEM